MCPSPRIYRVNSYQGNELTGRSSVFPEILRQLTVITEEDSQGSAPPQVQALMIDGGATYEAKLFVKHI